MSTNVSLTPALENYVKNKVAQGFYGSVSEFIREAIRLYRRQDMEYLQEMHAQLDQAAGEIDRGEISLLNMQEVMDEVDAERPAGRK